MGLCNALATFKTFMSWVFLDFINRFVVVSVDAILIHSRTQEELLGHVGVVLSRLDQFSFYVLPRVCSCMATETALLGLHVRRDGIPVHSENSNVIKPKLNPLNITNLRSIHVLVQFFRRFIFTFSVELSLSSPCWRKTPVSKTGMTPLTQPSRTSSMVWYRHPYLFPPVCQSPFACISTRPK